MRVSRLLMKNWCQHADRRVLFHSGMNALLGPNGSGKTTAMTAILFALTGDHSRNDGVKASNIRHAADPSEPAHVTLNFEHCDMLCEIHRSLRGAQSTLTVKDMSGNTLESVRGDNKVTARVMELLNTTERILSDYVFVGQGQMFSPFAADTKPADRAVAFQRLFGIDRAEAVWTAAGEYLASVPVSVSRPGEVAAAAEAVQAAATSIRSVDTELAACSAYLGWDRESDPDSRLLTSYEVAKHAACQLTTLRSTRADAVRRCFETRQSVQSSKSELAAFEAAIKLSEPNEQGWHQTLRQESAKDTAIDQINRLETQTALLDIQLSDLNLRRPDASDQLPAQQLMELLTGVDTEVAVDTRFVSSFSGAENQSVAKCPTCGTAVAAFRVELDIASARLATNRSTAASLRTSLEKSQRAESALQVWAANSNALQQQLSRVSFERSQIVMPDLSDAEVVRARESLTQLATWRECRRLTSQDLSVSAATLAAVKSSCRVHRDSYRTAAATASAVSEAEAESAKDRLRTKTTLSQQATTLSERKQGEQRRLAEAETRLTSLQAAETDAVMAEQRRSRLMRIRDVLHRDNLPQLVVRRQLDSLSVMANELLATFNAQFRLSPQAGISYEVEFFDGRRQPITRLSAGEQVLASLAFRIAINASFARELGMLCLDEPTVYLDSENLGCLDTALDCLRRFSQSRGLQCILITHESIGHLFDHVEHFGI